MPQMPYLYHLCRATDILMITIVLMSLLYLIKSHDNEFEEFIFCY